MEDYKFGWKDPRKMTESELFADHCARQQEALQNIYNRANQRLGAFGAFGAFGGLTGLGAQNANAPPSREEQLASRNAINLAKWKKRYTEFVTNLDFQNHNRFAKARRIYKPVGAA